MYCDFGTLFLFIYLSLAGRSNISYWKTDKFLGDYPIV